MAWHIGPRDEVALKALLMKERLSHSREHLPLRCCYTDGLAAYERHLPSQYDHRVEPGQTWRIESRNLNLRTPWTETRSKKRLSRKTICFSESERVHAGPGLGPNVVGIYIERYYYRHGRFAKAVKAHQRI